VAYTGINLDFHKELISEGISILVRERGLGIHLGGGGARDDGMPVIKTPIFSSLPTGIPLSLASFPPFFLTALNPLSFPSCP